MSNIIRKFSKLLSFQTCIFLITSSFAQEQLIHQPKVFVSKSGNVFWNKKLPVYMKLATSPDDTAKTYWVKSKLTAKYADPFFFDTEGINFIRTKWAVDKNTGQTVEPKIEVSWGVYNDSKAPLTQIKYLNSKYYEKQFRLYLNSGLKVTLASKDELSGIQNVYYSIDKSEYLPYNDTLTFNEPGDFTLKYYAVDQVGNVEKPKTVLLSIDNESPVTEMENTGEWNESNASARGGIKLSAKDDRSGVRNIIFSLDEGKEQVYSSPIYTNSLQEGSHTLSFFSIDAIGNREEMQQFDFYVDKKAPLITMETVGDKYTINGKEFSSGRTKIKLTAIDNKAGVREIWYSVNASKYKIYDKPFYLDGKGGNRNIKFYAVDNVNNRNIDSDASRQNFSTPYLDLTGPKLSNNFSGPTYRSRDTLFLSPRTKIILGGNDAEAGLQKLTYQINGGEELDYLEPFLIQNSGFYEIAQTGYDNVNNSNRKEFFVVVDADGPANFPTFSTAVFSQRTDESGTTDIYPQQVGVYLAATDGKVGSQKITYSINNSPEKIYTSPIVGFEKGKLYNIDVIAYDWLENKTKSSIKFEILKSK